jgi:hypothetical protein
MERMMQHCAYSRTYKHQHSYVEVEEFLEEWNEILWNVQRVLF